MGRFYRLGTIAEDYTYDAFGNQLSDEPTVYNPFRYSGEYFDTETGLIYLRARYYDSSIGRFISEDPIKDGLNWYVYCGNDPVNFVDPSGMISVIFVSSNMSDQADVRKEYYTEKYGTDSYKIVVSSAEEFIKRWNDFFCLVNEYEFTIDAIEIISHGSIEGDVGKSKDGTAYSTGYIYFTDDKENKLYARNVDSGKNGDFSVTDLNAVTATELNINSCNSTNKDTYNIVYGFKQKVTANSYTGFDGGAQWDAKMGDHVPGGGYYDANRPWYKGGAWYYVKAYQHTWWKYVDKINGEPAREREGRRYFN